MSTKAGADPTVIASVAERQYPAGETDSAVVAVFGGLGAYMVVGAVFWGFGSVPFDMIGPLWIGGALVTYWIHKTTLTQTR